jgi:predicted enzyme related to lactoylglutathione lyase
MQKFNVQNNAINWFEIPVTDTARAKKFYETILDIHMEILQGPGDDVQILFPRDPSKVSALSGRVSGALVKNDRAKPSAEGALVYLNASPRVQEMIDRVETAGGKVLMPKTKIPAGEISIILDTEGNRVALHAEN